MQVNLEQQKVGILLAFLCRKLKTEGYVVAWILLEPISIILFIVKFITVEKHLHIEVSS